MAKASLPATPKVPKPKVPSNKATKSPIVKGGLKGYLAASKMAKQVS